MPLSRISSPSIQNFSVEAQDFANNSIETYTSSSGRPLTNRNLIINGAMQVAQRNTSVTGITSGNYYTADRWRITISSAGTWTMNVESSGPTNTEFRSSANVICTTADSSLAAGDNLRFQQRFEGQNLQGIKKGTSAAESLTVSFWVKSSNTGTYICEFVDSDNTRQISKSYTIDAADTWEKKTITVPPDTTGQLDNDNANSFQLSFWLAAGTDYTSGTLNSSAWASNTNANRAVNQLNLANLSGNYWAVTGVQLEIGEVATPFEMRSIGQELALCQRYFQVYGSIGSTGTNGDVFVGTYRNSSSLFVPVPFQVPMRTTPSFTSISATGAQWSSQTQDVGITSFSISNTPTPRTAFLSADSSAAFAAGNGIVYTNNGTTTNAFSFSAEL
jgi:hypothetical protein